MSALSLFSERLHLHRKKLGLSQDELGQRLGVSQNKVGMWERAESFPDLQEFLHLCQLFEVSTEYLSGRASHTAGLPPGWFIIDEDKLSHRVPGDDWGWQIPQRFRIVDYAAVRKIQQTRETDIDSKRKRGK